MSRILSAAPSTGAWLMAIAVLATFVPQWARADEIAPPSVPSDLVVPSGNKPFLVGHAFGTQNYVCLPSAASTTGFAFTLFTPEATLLDENDEQVITHFFGPNPAEPGVIRAAWQHSRDSSTVWAKVVNSPSTDPLFVAPNSIPWLLLQEAGVQAGPTGGDVLTSTTFIQRVNTHGGVAPSSGCSAPTDVGNKAFMPYTADYFFYKATHKAGAQ
jgi:Protein of unknown function (DUF3455)